MIACTDALHMSVSPCMRRWCQHAMPTSPSSLTGSLAILTFRLSISEYRPTYLLTHTSLIQSHTITCHSLTSHVTHSHPQYHTPHHPCIPCTITPSSHLPHTLPHTQHIIIPAIHISSPPTAQAHNLRVSSHTHSPMLTLGVSAKSALL